MRKKWPYSYINISSVGKLAEMEEEDGEVEEI